MLGVDFVISALFETSGLRPEGDCAPAILRAITVNPEANTNKLVTRMRPSVTPHAGSQNKQWCSRERLVTL
jgi:hypothetical protein